MSENLFIGPAGWSYLDWDGVVYPSRKGKSFDPLAFIASYFNLIEINSTFYRIPDPAVTRRWTKRVEHNSSFRFTAKLHRDCTHAKGPLSQTDLNAFVRGVAPIYDEKKLGFVLVQFPWSFKNGADSKKMIGMLISALAPLPVAVEVRHGSWEGGDTLSFFEACGATLCCIDQPIIGHSLTSKTHLAGPAGAYFRMHGRNAAKWFGRDTSRDERYDYLYSHEELAKWSKKISSVVAAKKPVFVVTNNHFRGQAVANAFELQYMVTGEKVSLPATVADAFPELEKIARPSGGHSSQTIQKDVQGDLFEAGSTPEDEEQD